MTNFRTVLIQFILSHHKLIYILSTISGFFFIISLLSLPFFISLLPCNYFIMHQRKITNTQSFSRTILNILRNCLGYILVCTGIVLLFMPGQGILTLIAGLSLTDIPGKRKIEFFFIQKKGVRKGLNWFRKKTRSPLLIFPDQN